MDAREEQKVPTWVTRVAGEHGAHAIWYLMNKQISSSDACNQQNRFLIGKRVSSHRLLPTMSDAEKQAASFLNHPEVGRRRCLLDRLPGGERRRRLVERNHGGLNLMVYGQRGWGCPGGTAAARRCSKDPITKLFRQHCFMETENELEIWAFRNKYQKLCFVFGNMTVSRFLFLEIRKQSRLFLI